MDSWASVSCPLLAVDAILVLGVSVSSAVDTGEMWVWHKLLESPQRSGAPNTQLQSDRNSLLVTPLARTFLSLPL